MHHFWCQKFLLCSIFWPQNSVIFHHVVKTAHLYSSDWICKNWECSSRQTTPAEASPRLSSQEGWTADRVAQEVGGTAHNNPLAFAILFYECSYWSCRRTFCEGTNQCLAHPQIQQQVTAAQLQGPCMITCVEVLIFQSHPKQQETWKPFISICLAQRLLVVLVKKDLN